MKTMQAIRNLSKDDRAEMLTRHSLRCAAEVRTGIQQLLRDNSEQAVAEFMQMPLLLIKRLATDDIGYLVDCLRWISTQDPPEDATP